MGRYRALRRAQEAGPPSANPMRPRRTPLERAQCPASTSAWPSGYVILDVPSLLRGDNSKHGVMGWTQVVPSSLAV